MNQLEPFIWRGTEPHAGCFPLDEVGQAGVTKLPAEGGQGCLAQLSVCALGLIPFRVFLLGVLGTAGSVHLLRLGCWRCPSCWGCTLYSAGELLLVPALILLPVECSGGCVVHLYN